MGKNAFVNRDWIGPAAAGVVVLTGLLSHPDQATSIVILTLATSFWWSARGRWLIGRVGLAEPKRRSRLRHAFVGQALCVLTAWGALVLIDEVVAAGAVLLVGVCLSALAWPWPWRLAQAAEDRTRTHDPSLAAQHLGAAGVLAALSLGAVVALNAVAAAMLAALVMSSLMDAWNERRRTRSTPRPMADIAPQVVEVEAPESRLEHTVEYTPVFEPLDLPVSTGRPISSPEPSPYLLFADEVAPKIEPSVEPLAVEQRSEAERPGEWPTPADESGRFPMADLPSAPDLAPPGLASPILPSALPAPRPEPIAPVAEPIRTWWSALPPGENVSSEPRSAQQMWEEARRRAEEWTGGRSLEQRTDRSSSPARESEAASTTTPDADQLPPAMGPPTQLSVGRRRAAQSTTEDLVQVPMTWESVEPGVGRRRAERLQAPRMDEVREASDVQPGLGRRMAEPRDTGAHARKYSGRRVATPQ